MALISPGVEVTIIDESNYLPAATSSVPFILIATAQNKASATGTGVAQGTLAATAGDLYLISSQRELVTVFGNPFFYKTVNGTPINGYELNEYGLLAAYSLLGASNRAYVMRADVDLSELTATTTRPTGDPDNGTYWLDLQPIFLGLFAGSSGGGTEWGIFEWSAATQTFSVKYPTQITDTADLDGGIPKESIGVIGSYAVVTTNANNPVYYKDSDNGWVLVGSDDWCNSHPTLQGSNANPTLVNGNSIVINGTTVTLSGTTVGALVSGINGASITGVTAANENGRLTLYADSTASSDGSTEDGIINIVNGTGTILTLCGIVAGDYYRPTLVFQTNTQIPRWRSTDTAPRPTGSVWCKTTAVNLGANLVVKKFDATLGVFVEQDAPLYANDAAANSGLDPSSGGFNIPQGATYAQYDPTEAGVFQIKLLERLTRGQTIVTSENTNPSFVIGETFTIQASEDANLNLNPPVTATLNGTTASDFVAAILAANVQNVTASVTTDGAVQIRHTQGGMILLKDTAGTPVADAGINTDLENVRAGNNSDLILSNWVALTYTASFDAPDQNPADGRKWYYSAVDQVDIMINDGSSWKGYRNVSNDVRGFNLTQTDPNGPQVSASEPTEQSDGTALVYGDLWIDTSDLENYPVIKRWQSVNGTDQWVTIDNTDQTTENGVLFADARWDTDGTTDVITGAYPTIKSLLTSNYLDLDAPEPSLYPDGALLFNTRRSGFNVKSFQVNYFNAIDFPDDTLPDEKDTWVTVAGNKSNGSPYMGRQAVREIVVAAMKSAIDTSQDVREEQRTFNLIATPGYPELFSNMIALNNDRNNTAFVVGDTPLRLASDGNSIINWATNGGGRGTSTEDGLTNTDSYMGVFYPSCQTTDLTGSTVVQPPSHMMLRTIVRSDEVSFPWLAPAGIRRGLVDNAFAIGYIDATTGEFVQINVSQSTRDTLYENRINPITFIPGTGIVNYGNKTTQTATTALDRINVARLVNYVRSRLEQIGNQFVFEPNDKITRDELKNAVESLMNDLLAKRGIYDYLVVCDETNNTPARIDRNELYCDVALEPVKAAEFIYIPVRIQNTGEISGAQ